MDSNIQDRLQTAIDAICDGNRSEFCRRIGRDVSSLKDIIGGRAPHLAQQHLNEWIKRACKAVGIDGRVEVSSNDGKCRRTEIRHKYECVTSHCARRSGITLLYMTGIPLQQVMLISGHKDEDSIRHYLRLTKEENVAMLKDNPFFK